MRLVFVMECDACHRPICSHITQATEAAVNVHPALMMATLGRSALDYVNHCGKEHQPHRDSGGPRDLNFLCDDCALGDRKTAKKLNAEVAGLIAKATKGES